MFIIHETFTEEDKKMKEKIIIPKGFELKITSWENHGLSYNTVSTIGLRESQVRFILNVCSYFNPKSEGVEFFGQKIQEESFLFDLLKKEAEKWNTQNEYSEIISLLPDTAENIHQWFYKHVLSDPCLNSYGYCRAVSHFQVIYHPEEKVLMFREDSNGKPCCIKAA